MNNDGALTYKKGVEIHKANARCCIPHCEKEASAMKEWTVTQIKKANFGTVISNFNLQILHYEFIVARPLKSNFDCLSANKPC